MKLVADYSAYSYGRGTNPAGGGRIEIVPETPEEEKLLQGAGLSPHYAEQVYFVPCRAVRHSPNPHDDGLNPLFVELVRRYGWRVKGYPGTRYVRLFMRDQIVVFERSLPAEEAANCYNCVYEEVPADENNILMEPCFSCNQFSNFIPKD